MINIKTPEEIAQYFSNEFVPFAHRDEAKKELLQAISAERNANLEKIKELEKINLELGERTRKAEVVAAYLASKLIIANAKIKELESQLKELNEWKQGKKGIEDFYELKQALAAANAKIVELDIANSLTEKQYQCVKSDYDAIESQLATANAKIKELEIEISATQKYNKELENIIFSAESESCKRFYLQRIDYLKKEAHELSLWKESQISINNSWDVQAVGKAIDAKLGSAIHPEILPFINKLKDEAMSLRYALEEARSMFYCIRIPNDSEAGTDWRRMKAKEGEEDCIRELNRKHLE